MNETGHPVSLRVSTPIWPGHSNVREPGFARFDLVSTILFLTVADDPETWVRLGFILDGATVRLGSTAITLTGASADEKGVTGWNLGEDSPLPEFVEGLRTTATPTSNPVPDAGSTSTPSPPQHPNGITTIDHLVVKTPNLPRTIAAFEDLGWECRRTRDAGAYGEENVRQAFFWFGDVIVEVVGPQTADPEKADRPATFFGLALTAPDLDATAAFLGEFMKPPVDAVQKGRRISTISSRAGSSVAIAVMTPHLKETK